MRPILLMLAMLPVACADIRPGSPEACASEPRGSFALEMVEGRPFVEARINGEKARLLLDTGANVTFIGTEAARRLRLRGDVAFRSTTTAIGGKAESQPAVIDRFEFAGLVLPVEQVITVGLNSVGINNADGLLGIDALRQFDLELDMVQRRGTLYRARNCPAEVPHGMAGAQTFEMPTASTSPHAEITVELDGKPMRALLDTGAGSVLVDRRAALRSGITEQDLAADRVVTVRGAISADAGSAIHRFHSLRIGTAQVANPELRVTALPPSGADMVIGMTLLRNRKVWFSFASRRIYLGEQMR